MVWRRAEPTGVYGNPMKYLEDGNICKVSSTKKKGRSLWVSGRRCGEVPRGSCVDVESFLTGTENMKNGDYTAAFSYFQKAAERGYSKAQYNVGLCHEHGRGTPRDLSKVPHLLPRPQACALCCMAQSDPQK